MSVCTIHGLEGCARCMMDESIDVVVPKVHVHLLLDKSGSMAADAAQTMGGFNEYIKGLKATTDTEYEISLITFDHTVYPVYVGKKIADVPELTGKDYRCGGGTALFDAIGRVLGDVGKEAKEDATVGHLVVVITDGQDESSRVVSKNTALEIIGQAEKEAVTFAWLGANPDAFSGGRDLMKTSGATAATTNTLNYNGNVTEAFVSLSRGTRRYGAVRGMQVNSARAASFTAGTSFECEIERSSVAVSKLFSDEEEEKVSSSITSTSTKYQRK